MTSSDLMDKIMTVWIDTGGKIMGEEFPPHLPTSDFSFYYPLESQ